MHSLCDILAAPSVGATGDKRGSTTHLLRGLASALLTLAVAYCTAAAPTGAAYAASASISSDTEVRFGSDFTPLVLRSLTGDGAVLYVQSGGSIALTAQFEGGEGDTAFTWEESRDGGSTFALVASTRTQVPTEQTAAAEARKSAQPAVIRAVDPAAALQTTDGAATAYSTYMVADAQAPECGYLAYRLYAYDESVQRVPVMFTVYVTDAPAPDPDPPVPTPDPPAPDPAPSGGGGSGRIAAKTGDVAAAAAFLAAVVASGLALRLASRKARRREEDQQ